MKSLAVPHYLYLSTRSGGRGRKNGRFGGGGNVGGGGGLMLDGMFDALLTALTRFSEPDVMLV